MEVLQLSPQYVIWNGHSWLALLSVPIRWALQAMTRVREGQGRYAFCRQCFAAAVSSSGWQHALPDRARRVWLHGRVLNFSLSFQIFIDWAILQICQVDLFSWILHSSFSARSDNWRRVSCSIFKINSVVSIPFWMYFNSVHSLLQCSTDFVETNERLGVIIRTTCM